MARNFTHASSRELIERMEQRIEIAEQARRDFEARWVEDRRGFENRWIEDRRESEKRWVEDRRAFQDSMREMKQESRAREQRIEAGFQVLASRVENLRWWVLGFGLTVIAAIAAIVIGG